MKLLVIAADGRTIVKQIETSTMGIARKQRGEGEKLILVNDVGLINDGLYEWNGVALAIRADAPEGTKPPPGGSDYFAEVS